MWTYVITYTRLQNSSFKTAFIVFVYLNFNLLKGLINLIYQTYINTNTETKWNWIPNNVIAIKVKYNSNLRKDITHRVFREELKYAII